MARRRKHVDPIRVHLITLVVFGVIAGVALALWTFPKFFLGLVLLALSAVVYLKLYAFIEARLEAEEGRLAKDLGFDLEDDEDALLEELEEAAPSPKPKRRPRKPRRTDDGLAAAEPAVEVSEPGPAPDAPATPVETRS